MRRKVIQIAGSTQLVSLPRQWALRYKIQKGAELDIQEEGDHLIVRADSEPQEKKAELDISNLGEMIPRSISAFYKKGVDSLRIKYTDPALISVIHQALAKDTVGFEILEQGETHCTIKNVGGKSSEFHPIMRRAFLLLNTVSDECISLLRKGKYDALMNLSYLEEANNRFTTTAMRYLNTVGSGADIEKVGPMYFIVETLEQLADQYKYLCQHFSKLNPEKDRIKKEVLDFFEHSCGIVRTFSELFYKFDHDKLNQMRKNRDRLINTAHTLLKGKPANQDIWLTHHAIVLVQRSFQAIDSLLILKLNKPD
jgi:phosphate uptake regulator